VLEPPRRAQARNGIRTCLVVLSAAFPNSLARKLPWNLGQLRASAAQLEGRRRSDAFDLTIAPGRELGLALIDLRTSPLEAKSQRDPGQLRDALLKLAIHGLREGTPLHAILLDLVRKLFESPLSQLGVTLMRCSAVDARMELTTVGMPRVACAHANGKLTLHGVETPPLTALTHSAAPVELTALPWGSTWLAASDGFSNDSTQSGVIERLTHELDLTSVGLSLCQESPESLRELLVKLPLVAARPERDDATLVLLAADPSARLQSGIERRDAES
jgi:hypothetical protein